VTRYLSAEQVLLIHERVLALFGGESGLLSYSLLDSACQRPQATFEGKELYTSLFAKAAALGHSLVLNHPFVDGNKRTAWEAMKRFLGENGYHLKAAPDEIVSFMLDIAQKKLSIDQIANWLAQHSSPMEKQGTLAPL
jgi:death-on-curing protein